MSQPLWSHLECLMSLEALSGVVCLVIELTAIETVASLLQTCLKLWGEGKDRHHGVLAGAAEVQGQSTGQEVPSPSTPVF